MSINFEAANLAGYNNPPIEVFKATVDPVTNAISDAPSKTEIIRCLHRGSIPAIMQIAPDGSSGNLLWFIAWESSVGGDTLTFGNLGLMIMYMPDSESPIVATG